MSTFNGPAIREELLDELLSKVKSPDQLLGKDGLLKELTARLVEKALQGEMTEHLGYEPGQGVRDLRPIYAAASRQEAETALGRFDDKWGPRYPMIGASWRAAWERVVRRRALGVGSMVR